MKKPPMSSFYPTFCAIFNDDLIIAAMGEKQFSSFAFLLE